MKEAKKFINQSNHHRSIHSCPQAQQGLVHSLGVFRRKKWWLGGKTVGRWRAGAGLPRGPSGFPARRRRWNVQALASGAAWGAPGESPLAGSAGGGAPQPPSVPGQVERVRASRPRERGPGGVRGGGAGAGRGASLIGLSEPPVARRFYKAATGAGRSQATLLTPHSALLAEPARPRPPWPPFSSW